MDDLGSTRKAFRWHLLIVILLENVIFGLSLYLVITYTNFHLDIDFAIAGAVALIFTCLVVISSSNLLIQPLAFLRQAILHLSPSGNQPVKSPDIKRLQIGQELITNLVGQLYEIARV